MSELQAGRELDAQIAEQVMGLTVAARDWPCGYLPPCYWLVASETAEPTIDLMTERHPVYRDAAGELQPVPCYSTDLTAAWPVVEHLQARGWCYEVGTTAASEGSHYAQFMRGDYDLFEDEWETEHQAVAPTVPLVICRAALATLDQKE